MTQPMEPEQADNALTPTPPVGVMPASAVPARDRWVVDNDSFPARSTDLSSGEILDVLDQVGVVPARDLPLSDAELTEIVQLMEAADLEELHLSKHLDCGDLVCVLDDGTGVEARIYVEETADLIVAVLNALPRLVAALRAAREERAAADRCCDMHNHNCEPPSELCCPNCTEAKHYTFPNPHADGSKCVLAEPEARRTCRRCGTSWTVDIDACPHCQSAADLPGMWETADLAGGQTDTAAGEPEVKPC